MNAISAYYNINESPFPFKSTKDESLFLLALRKSLHLTKNVEYVDNLIKELVSDLKNFYDQKFDGITMGQGSWFSAPTIPTVPLARHAMVPPHTVGSFAVGNTYYVPLHQKQAAIQLVAMLALSDEQYTFDNSIKKLPYKEGNFNKSLDYVSQGELEDSYISIPQYMKWLYSTKSGMGYGLTPYRSPLGFRSDKSQQNFSALHVVCDSFVLHREVPDKDDILRSMYACQNKDGGFGEQPSMISEVFTTYCVILTAFMLHDDGYDKEKCIEFILSCQNPYGGFGNGPGLPSDSWHTNLAVLSLHALNVDYDKEKTIQFLLNCRNADGGYSLIPNGISEIFSTFRAMASLIILGVEISNKEDVVKWLQGMQDESGGFIFQKGKSVSFVGSHHAIAALYLLDSLPAQLDKCKKWIYEHQMKDGGFSRSTEGPSDTTDEGFIVLHSSYMLERKLNPYWVAIMT